MPYNLDCVLAPRTVQVGQWFEIKLETDYPFQYGQSVLCTTSCEPRIGGGSTMHLAGDLRGARFENGCFSFEFKVTQKGDNGESQVKYYIPFELVVDGNVKASADVRVLVK